MKIRKGKALAAGADGTAKRHSKDRQLVLLDGVRLRHQAASDCSRQMAHLEKAKAEWKRFEQHDKTGFERWKAATFGGFLTRLRELGALIREKESLILAVEMEMLSGRAKTLRSAHAKVQARRNQPEADAPPPPREEENFDGPRFEDISEIEQEMLFEDFLRSVLRMNPDRMSDERYEKMFADFKASAKGKERPDAETPPSPLPPKPGHSRLKEIYRMLVRRLHPDTRADDDEEVSALWHEVQEAYGTGNVERLEMLLALSDLQFNATGEHTSLFQMRSVLAELRRSFKAIQANLRAARMDLAWNFSRLRNRSALEKRVRGNLKSMLEWHEWRLRQLEAEIASWSAAPKARKRKAGRTETGSLF